MNRRGGFSLVELTIATAVVSVLTILVMSFLVNKFVQNARDNARADLQLQTQLTLDLINRDLKHAANVDDLNRWADTYAPGAPADQFSWQSDADTLVLAVPAQESDDDILYEDPQVYISYKDNYIYFISGGTLYKRILPAQAAGNGSQVTCPAGTAGCSPDPKLAAIIDNLTFTYYDAADNQVAPSNARSVKVSMRVIRQIFGKEIVIEESLRTVFRNE